MAQRCRILPLVLLLVAVAVAGCTPPVHIALDPKVVPVLTKVDCKNVVIEDEVTVAVDISTGGSVWVGGCLGAAIDASVNKTRSRKAEELVQPLLDQTSDVDLRGQLGEALEFTMQDIEWLNIDTVRSTAAIPHPDELKGITSPLLHFSTAYFLVPKCYSLDMTTSARLWLPAEKKAVFLGYFTYFSEPVVDAVEEDAVEAWAANGGAAYRAAVTEGVAEIAKMVRLDLPPDGNLPSIKQGAWVRLKYLNPRTNADVKWRVQVLSESTDRLILREEGGNLWSIPRSLLDMDSIKDSPKADQDGLR
ncbi:MAG: hypothetical protein IPK64_17085 [bacterium]|nr:hypothetical protein [bacterium]